jgi:hypothetical protein
VDTRFINGMARAGEKLIILLDIRRVLRADVQARGELIRGVASNSVK